MSVYDQKLVLNEESPPSIAVKDQRIMLVVVIVCLALVIMLLPFWLSGQQMKFTETLLAFSVFVIQFGYFFC
jgi:flagellar basal body-associated protein FliL